MDVIIMIIRWLMQIFTLGIIVYVFLSYFLQPYHPLRQGMERFFEPMLKPIRRILPGTGMFDFSPIILLIIVQLSGTIIISLLSRLG
jgi:YggT family protein